MKQTNDEMLLRKKEVLRILGISNSTYYNRIKDGTLTPGVLLGPRCKAHPASEIQACIDALIAKRNAAFGVFLNPEGELVGVYAGRDPKRGEAV